MDQVVRKYWERIASPLDCSGGSKTKQSFVDECDINVIIRRLTSGQELVHMNEGRPVYGDFTTAEDYLDAMNRVTEAQNLFLAMPVEIRNRFKNDPAQLIEFCDDIENNLEEAIELGLAERRPPPVSTEPEGEPVVETPTEMPVEPA